MKHDFLWDASTTPSPVDLLSACSLRDMHLQPHRAILDKLIPDVVQVLGQYTAVGQVALQMPQFIGPYGFDGQGFVSGLSHVKQLPAHCQKLIVLMVTPNFLMDAVAASSGLATAGSWHVDFCLTGITSQL